MIIDVVRHKLLEGVLTLLVIAVAVVSIGVAEPLPHADAATAVAPLQPSLTAFEIAHPILAALLGIVLIMHTAIRLSRATIRAKIYPTTTVAVIALTGIAIAGIATAGNLLATLFVGVLTSELIARMLYSLKHNARTHHIFTAMMALGTMPLVDSSTLGMMALLPLLLISLRARTREVIVAVAGGALPLFIYCYVVWCGGAVFSTAATALWDNMLLDAPMPIVEVLTLKRLIFVGVLLFMGLCSAVIYRSERLSMTLTARNSWTMLQLCAILLIAIFALLPSVSAASLLVVALIAVTMLPLLLQRMNISISIIGYIVLLILGFVAM